MSRKSARILFTTLTALAVAAIWIHSMMPSGVSSGESMWVLERLRSLLSALHVPDGLTEHIVRKCAHFTEYAVLGALLRWTWSAWNGGHRAALMLTVLAIPFLDETIQMFSYGRSAQISDVWLDLFGCATGLLLAWVLEKVIFLVKMNQRK